MIYKMLTFRFLIRVAVIAGIFDMDSLCLMSSGVVEFGLIITFLNDKRRFFLCTPSLRRPRDDDDEEGQDEFKALSRPL